MTLCPTAGSADVVMDEGEKSCEELQDQMDAMSELIGKLTNELTELKSQRSSHVNVKEFTSAMNDTDLEQRVEALEFQMLNVQEDVSSLDVEVTDLEEDIEAQITVILEDQVNQDDRIENLEGITNGLAVSDFEMNASITELDSRVTTLESLNGTDENVIEALNELDAEVELLNGTVKGLSVSILNVEETVVTLEQTDEELGIAVYELDSRVSELESLNGTNDDGVLNETVAFHAYLGSYDTLLEGSIVPFGNINVNIGDAYNGETGQFTVPSGGAGLYYFYVHLVMEITGNGQFDIRHNGNATCNAFTSASHGDGFSCGGVIVLQEGTLSLPLFYIFKSKILS